MIELNMWVLCALFRYLFYYSEIHGKFNISIQDSETLTFSAAVFEKKER